MKYPNNPLITIITPTYNSEKTINSNLNSIAEQTYQNFEHLIIDNLSSDNTVETIKNNNSKKTIIYSEKDNGIFNAINKGIQKSKGDIICILHSDDFFFNKYVLKNVVDAFNLNGVDAVYGDLLYVRRKQINNIVRFWKSSNYKLGIFLKGWAPPHPCFFVNKMSYDRLGFYKEDLDNASDFELMYRFLEKNKISFKYLNKTLVVMRYGGESNKSIKNIIKQNLTIIKILGINKNILKIIFFLLFKFLNRIKQFYKR